MKEKQSDWIVGLYRSGVVAGISALIWWQTHFVTAEKFSDYREAHDKLNNERVVNIHNDISDMKETIRRLEAKVDVLLREHKQAMLEHKRILEEIYE